MDALTPLPGGRVLLVGAWHSISPRLPRAAFPRSGFNRTKPPVPQTNPVGGGADAPEGTLKSEMAEPLHLFREKLGLTVGCRISFGGQEVY